MSAGNNLEVISKSRTEARGHAARREGSKACTRMPWREGQGLDAMGRPHVHLTEKWKLVAAPSFLLSQAVPG